MPALDYRDFYILSKSHPKYNSYKLTENDPIRIVVQKIENILVSNKGDVLGDPDYGCDINYLLWKTSVPTESIKRIIYEQIGKYVPEAFNLNFSAEVNIFEGTVKDILYIEIFISDANITYVFK